MERERRCSSCDHALEPVIDLGGQPLANSYLTAEQLAEMEPHYPLVLMRCDACHLLQVPPVVHEAAIFSDYLYFSSYSQSWLDHARSYCDAIVDRLRLGPSSFVVEIASNDGYLLKNIVRRGIPCLGIEPAANVAKVAVEQGIPTQVAFFGRSTAEDVARTTGRADLIAANNVMAHVPDLNDFLAGLKILLAPGGVVTIEFPHLMKLIEETQFDTIYHEHYSYFSLIAVEAAFLRHDLQIVGVDEIPTHGGSLRIYAAHIDGPHRRAGSVDTLAQKERALGYDKPEIYRQFAKQCVEVKGRLLDFLISARRDNKSVVGYGAPAKGNTLLNFCGARTEYIGYTVDRSPHKQNRFLPGTHIPIHDPALIEQTKPDFVLILPWNLKDEIMTQMAHVRGWGGRFVVAVPTLSLL
jgi:SAM-dependent methyltransferase